MSLKDIKNWEVETSSGWKSFDGIKKTNKNEVIEIEFESGLKLKCSTCHKLKLKNKTFKYVTHIKIGNEILGRDNVIEIVKSKKTINKSTPLYDLINVADGNEYYTNDIISHNCAFIDGVEEIWLSSQYTLSTGGRAILLSTPNGVGNFFHKTWVDAESGKNNFNTIRLPWNLHPERDQEWRDRQTMLSGVKGAAQECDCIWGESVVRVKDKDTNEEFTISLKDLYNSEYCIINNI